MRQIFIGVMSTVLKPQITVKLEQLDLRGTTKKIEF